MVRLKPDGTYEPDGDTLVLKPEQRVDALGGEASDLDPTSKRGRTICYPRSCCAS